MLRVASLAFLTIATLSLVGLSLPSEANACGGFFCNGTTLIAVDQTKERILFEVNGDGTLDVNVEITYSGSPEGFAWVVPVPPSFTGELGVLPPSTLRLLDAATAPRIIPPNPYGGEDFDEDLAAGGSADDDDDADPPNEDGGPVDVIDLPQVGPYAPQLVSSDDASALVEWLNENGYLITDEMAPLVGNYVASDMNFLAMKLAPEAGIQDIAPIKITYESETPMIPLVLTAVAAEPEMGILVFAAGDQRYEPSNYEGLFIDDELLRADPRTGETNYYPLLSFLSDQFDRQAFFTEYSDSSANLNQAVQNTWIGSEDQEEAWDYIAQLAQSHGWVSRMYTRMNNVDMEVDPFFQGVGTTVVSNVHDLSGQDPVHIDFAVDPQLECNDTYCGEGGVCASTESNLDGCVCGGGYLARRILGPSASAIGAQATVTCQDASFDMLASAVAAVTVDPCESFSCGELGSCVVLGGFPSCQCPVGTAAVATFDGMISCEAVVTTYGPDQLLWPEWRSTEAEGSNSPAGAAALALACGNSCSAAGEDTPSAALLSLLLGLGLLVVRRSN
ncbi:MAG: DUF2330 domain-containing protein [Myxococcota bacterium]|nr:DUF2330 domain-containing protein [Myxococcota bacterium]